MDKLIVLAMFVIALILITPEVPTKQTFQCTPEQREPGICYTLYDPVCGYDMFNQEIGEFTNDCEACQFEDVFYYVKGGCD